MVILIMCYLSVFYCPRLLLVEWATVYTFFIHMSDATFENKIHTYIPSLEESPMDIATLASFPGAGDVVSGEETSMLTSFGSLAVDDLEAFQLLDDVDADDKDDEAEEDITSVPINQVVLKMRGKATNLAMIATTVSHKTLNLKPSRLSFDSGELGVTAVVPSTCVTLKPTITSSKEDINNLATDTIRTHEIESLSFSTGARIPDKYPLQ